MVVSRLIAQSPHSIKIALMVIDIIKLLASALVSLLQRFSFHKAFFSISIIIISLPILIEAFSMPSPSGL